MERATLWLEVPHPEEPRLLRGVSKDEAPIRASWFEMRAKSALLTMRGES